MFFGISFALTKHKQNTNIIITVLLILEMAFCFYFNTYIDTIRGKQTIYASEHLVEKLNILYLLLFLSLYRLYIAYKLDKRDKELKSLYEKICFYWQPQEVRSWLISINTPRLLYDKFLTFDGNMLKKFHEIKNKTNDYFYNHLTQIANLNTDSVVKFDIEFDKLISESKQYDKQYKKLSNEHLSLIEAYTILIVILLVGIFYTNYSLVQIKVV